MKEHRPVPSEKLYPHLREIDEAANSRLEPMMPEPDTTGAGSVIEGKVTEEVT